ncbi:hypothetical protein IWX50DRAFT_393476 [Phyllosticta citricarpa]
MTLDSFGWLVRLPESARFVALGWVGCPDLFSLLSPHPLTHSPTQAPALALALALLLLLLLRRRRRRPDSSVRLSPFSTHLIHHPPSLSLSLSLPLSRSTPSSPPSPQPSLLLAPPKHSIQAPWPQRSPSSVPTACESPHRPWPRRCLGPPTRAPCCEKVTSPASVPHLSRPSTRILLHPLSLPWLEIWHRENHLPEFCALHRLQRNLLQATVFSPVA